MGVNSTQGLRSGQDIPQHVRLSPLAFKVLQYAFQCLRFSVCKLGIIIGTTSFKGAVYNLSFWKY